MKAQTKSQITSIAHITIAYTIIGVIISLYDHFLLTSELSTGTSESYSLLETLVYNVAAGFCGGLFSGIFLTNLNRKIRNKPFIYGQILGALSFLIIFVSLSLATTAISSYTLERSGLNNTGLNEIIKERIFNSFHLKNLIVWSIVFQLTQFYLQLQQKFGPGNMWKIFTGKYHSPKVEPRIFMFLDLKSSTSIAENLGESKYHQFLKDVFSDITEPIRENKAEIYQYVGDEIVVTWHQRKLRDKSNCINVFFDIESEFQSKRKKYLEKYGTIPTFKASAHVGNSIAGEIGIIKKDITYSGDLLNTTARIQGKCNELESKFLITTQLKNFVSDSIQNWNLHSKGFISLRGKTSEVELFSVTDHWEKS